MKPFPFAPVTYQFAEAHASCILTIAKAFDGTPRVKLGIQAIDAYSRQHELSIEYGHVPGNSKIRRWEVRAYRHPGVRSVTEVSAAVATKLVARILHLADKYPSLLFNAQTTERGRNVDFVLFNEALLAGATPSVRLLA